MSMALYRCGNTLLLATDEHTVMEHVNRHQTRKLAVHRLPDGSLILHKNQPYDIADLTNILKSHAKASGLDINKPLSIIIDDRFIN